MHKDCCRTLIERYNLSTAVRNSHVKCAVHAVHKEYLMHDKTQAVGQQPCRAGCSYKWTWGDGRQYPFLFISEDW